MVEQVGPASAGWYPLLFAGLVGLALLLVWLSFAPAGRLRPTVRRLDGYVTRGKARDAVEDSEMSKPFFQRVVLPILRTVVSTAGRLVPAGDVTQMRRKLLQAGSPGNLTPLDFSGVRLLAALLLGVPAFFLLSRGQPFTIALRNAVIGALIGYILPSVWLNTRVRRRQHQILRALPDALDMLTIGVEAGLAFESALLKVGERWNNALTAEFRRVVGEMRVGISRDEALQRMSDRTGVDDLATFVAVLIQSSQLGVSIAHILHTQAAQMRIRRRQRAEELARQAGIKMIFPLGTLIFPALMVVILGPSVPILLSFFGNLLSGPGLSTMGH